MKSLLLCLVFICLSIYYSNAERDSKSLIQLLRRRRGISASDFEDLMDDDYDEITEHHCKSSGDEAVKEFRNHCQDDDVVLLINPSCGRPIWSESNSDISSSCEHGAKKAYNTFINTCEHKSNNPNFYLIVTSETHSFFEQHPSDESQNDANRCPFSSNYLNEKRKMPPHLRNIKPPINDELDDEDENQYDSRKQPKYPSPSQQKKIQKAESSKKQQKPKNDLLDYY